MKTNALQIAVVPPPGWSSGRWDLGTCNPGHARTHRRPAPTCPDFGVWSHSGQPKYWKTESLFTFQIFSQYIGGLWARKSEGSLVFSEWVGRWGGNETPVAEMHPLREQRWHHLLEVSDYPITITTWSRLLLQENLAQTNKQDEEHAAPQISEIQIPFTPKAFKCR